MGWLSKSVKKWGKSIKKRAPLVGTIAGGLLGGPLGASIGASIGGAIGGDEGGGGGSAAGFAAEADRRYGDSEKLQADALATSQDRFNAEGEELDILRNKADTIYDPLEREIANEVSGEADVEGAANQARNEFTTNFDQAVGQAKRERLQSGVRPNAAMEARLNRQSAYDRARGSASLANAARTEEDDRHFLRKSTFFSQNGSGIRDRLRAGIQDRYGAREASQNNAAQSALAQGDRYQGYSDNRNAQSGNGLNALTSLAGTVFGSGALGGGGGLFSGGGLFGGGGNSSGQQPSAQGSHGSAASVPRRQAPPGFNQIT